MDVKAPLTRAAGVAVACVACCAAPVLVTMGITAGAAALAWIFAGLLGAAFVLLLGVGWVAARLRARAVEPCQSSNDDAPSCSTEGACSCAPARSGVVDQR